MDQPPRQRREHLSRLSARRRIRTTTSSLRSTSPRCRARAIASACRRTSGTKRSSTAIRPTTAAATRQLPRRASRRDLVPRPPVLGGDRPPSAGLRDLEAEAVANASAQSPGRRTQDDGIGVKPRSQGDAANGVRRAASPNTPGRLAVIGPAFFVWMEAYLGAGSQPKLQNERPSFARRPLVVFGSSLA